MLGAILALLTDILCSVETLKSVLNIVSVSVVLASILSRFVRSVAEKRSKLGVLRRQAINVGYKTVKFLNVMNQQWQFGLQDIQLLSSLGVVRPYHTLL